MPRFALSKKTLPKHVIPDKLYFKIGEVADLVGVKPYVLRYWETEFKEIGPVKSRTNQRLYKRRDVEIIFTIKDLLYQERYTISGARKKLKDDGEGREAASQQVLSFSGKENPLKGELNALLQDMMESLRNATS